MTSFAWRNALLSKTTYRVQSGGHQLSLQRCYRNEQGIPIFMVAGFGQSNELFWGDGSDSGLAPYLADRGFDVYVAECRGKGASWPRVNRQSDWGLHHIITEDIPAHLAYLAKLRPGQAQFWLGHGLGSVMLSAAYARMDLLPTPLLGMIHFAAARRCQLEGLAKTLSYMFWQAHNNLLCVLLGRAGFSDKRAESSRLSQELQGWASQPDWLDPLDGFDYRRALRRKGLPPSLYFSLDSSNLWGQIADTRLWLQELGHHDAQLVGVSRRGGSRHNYNQTSLLTHRSACEDQFLVLQNWLDRKQKGPAFARQSA